MGKATKTLAAINAALEQRQGTGFRNHLGASVLGRECARQLWYIFRWATKSRHRGQLLRLFQRGNEEEIRIINFLRKAGIHVEDTDPTTGKQFRIGAFDGHLGGSLDGILHDTPDFPGIRVLGEFKTHNDKSYKKVITDLPGSKYEHVVQMQLYMHYEQLPAALYFAVNKNDDNIDITTVHYDRALAEQHIDRAGRIIYAQYPPDRIPNASPGFYICRFCDQQEVCHNGATKEKHCRTCIHSHPAQDGNWLCTRYNYPLTEVDQKRGCADHSMIPEG